MWGETSRRLARMLLAAGNIYLDTTIGVLVRKKLEKNRVGFPSRSTGPPPLEGMEHPPSEQEDQHRGRFGHRNGIPRQAVVLSVQVADDVE